MKLFATSAQPGHRSARMSRTLAAGMVLAVAALLGATAMASRADDEAAANVVEIYQRQLDAGTANLAFANDGHGYLGDLLRAFHISRNSQLLVFSASSLQFDHITQKWPRALYYQDNIAVGSVHDGRYIEIIATDRNTGVAFYTLDVAKTDKPHFVRRTSECVVCHGFASRWAPGLMVANSDTGPDGLLFNVDSTHVFHLTDDRTPFEDRYGGWYVTGNTGTMKHRGNVTLDPDNMIDLPPGGLNVASLADRIDTTRYLEPGSDIVSLLTLEHQAGFVNLVTAIDAQYRELKNAAVVPALRTTKQDVDATIAELVDYMTFAHAVALPSPVKGSSGFAQSFASQGPRDTKGRSLRQFDLVTRLFRYPLSYMIFSQSFDALNPLAKDRVLRRLYDVLSGPGMAARGGPAAINILASTKSGLPDFWKAVPETGPQAP